MAHPNAAKGAKWERDVTRYLREHLDPATRKPRQEGLGDVGDIHSAGAVVQAKDWKDWKAAIREGLDGAVKQAGNANLWPPAAVVKRARRPVGEAYTILRLDDFIALVKAARAAERDSLGE